MKKILWMCVGLLVLAAPLAAQTVKLPAEIKAVRGAEISAGATLSFVGADGKPASEAVPAPQKKEANPPPIALPGFRVLIVEQKQKNTTDQVNILNSLKLVRYLKTNTFFDSKIKDDVGWRVVENGEDAASLPEAWRNALKPKRDSHPWIIISNGTTGVSQALPATLKDTLELLEQVRAGSVSPVGPANPERTLATVIGERIRWWEENYPQYTTKP
jgi:hypothetical protein